MIGCYYSACRVRAALSCACATIASGHVPQVTAMCSMQIEVQAVAPGSLSGGKPQDGSAGKSPDDARALPEGSQGEYTDVSQNSPSGGSNPGNDKASGGTSSTKAEGSSERQESSQGHTSTSNEGKKKESSKAGSKTGSSRDAKVAAGSNSGTIGGRGTQEEYQQARVRFMSPTGAGVCVSADSITLGEDQMGLLVTASFDEL